MDSRLARTKVPDPINNFSTKQTTGSKRCNRRVRSIAIPLTAPVALASSYPCSPRRFSWPSHAARPSSLPPETDLDHPAPPSNWPCNSPTESQRQMALDNHNVTLTSCSFKKTMMTSSIDCARENKIPGCAPTKKCGNAICEQQLHQCEFVSATTNSDRTHLITAVRRDSEFAVAK